MGALVSILAAFQITTRDLADVTPEEVNNPDVFSIYWSPITAVALIVAGALVLFMVRKEKRISHR